MWIGDWYRLEAVAGQTYTVETVSVAANLASSSGPNCRGFNSTGLGIVVFDPSLSTRVEEQCNANGGGNVHTTVTFEAGLSGTYYIWIIPNSRDTFGNYSVRIPGQGKLFLPFMMR